MASTSLASAPLSSLEKNIPNTIYSKLKGIVYVHNRTKRNSVKDNFPLFRLFSNKVLFVNLTKTRQVRLKISGNTDAKIKRILPSCCAHSRVNLCEGDWSACLPVHQSAQSSLALDDAVWDTHLAAKSWQENDQLENRRDNTRKFVFQKDLAKQLLHLTNNCHLSIRNLELWSVLRVKKLVSFDPHRGFRWRNSDIIASDHFLNWTVSNAARTPVKYFKFTSIGSTSWAMMTSWAFLLSTREVTLFTPVWRGI